MHGDGDWGHSLAVVLRGTLLNVFMIDDNAQLSPSRKVDQQLQKLDRAPITFCLGSIEKALEVAIAIGP